MQQGCDRRVDARALTSRAAKRARLSPTLWYKGLLVPLRYKLPVTSQRREPAPDGGTRGAANRFSMRHSTRFDVSGPRGGR